MQEDSTLRPIQRKPKIGKCFIPTVVKGLFIIMLKPFSHDLWYLNIISVWEEVGGTC